MGGLNCALPIVSNGREQVRTYALCNAIISKSWELGVPVTPKRLELLAYYVIGWHFAIEEKPLIDETVGSNSTGPVLSTLRAYYASCADKTINDYMRRSVRGSYQLEICCIPKNLTSTLSVIAKTCTAFKAATTDRMLENATSIGGAWEVSRCGLDSRSLSVIHPEILKNEFVHLAQRLSARRRQD